MNVEYPGICAMFNKVGGSFPIMAMALIGPGVAAMVTQNAGVYFGGFAGLWLAVSGHRFLNDILANKRISMRKGAVIVRSFQAAAYATCLLVGSSGILNPAKTDVPVQDIQAPTLTVG